MRTVKQQSHDNGSYKIKEQPFYLPQKNEVALFESAYKNKLPIMLKGPTGNGKTRLVEHMAWKLSRPLYTVACHEDLSGNDLTGRYIIKGDEFEWIDGPLLMAVKHGGIAYLDEIVEARKDTTVLIHPLTDYRRCLPIEKLGKTFYTPDEFMLVISYNPTYQSILKELKPSTRQRFVSIELGWPSEELETQIVHQESGIEEETARRLVKAANKIRNLVYHGLVIVCFCVYFLVQFAFRPKQRRTMVCRRFRCDDGYCHGNFIGLYHDITEKDGMKTYPSSIPSGLNTSSLILCKDFIRRVQLTLNIL